MAVLATEKALTRLPSGRTKSLKSQRYNHVFSLHVQVCASNSTKRRAVNFGLWGSGRGCVSNASKVEFLKERGFGKPR